MKSLFYKIREDFLCDFDKNRKSVVLYLLCVPILIIFFKLISSFLWSSSPFNVDVSIYTEWLVPWVSDYTDGIEFYFYSIFTFLVAAFIYFLGKPCREEKVSGIAIYSSFMFFLLTILYFRVQLKLPQLHGLGNESVFVGFSVFALYVCISQIKKSILLYSSIVAVFLFISLVQSFPFSFFNNSYYYYPAFQILNGKNLSEAYMQYDYLTTFIYMIPLYFKIDVTNISWINGFINFSGLVFLFVTLRKRFELSVALFTSFIFILFNYFANYSEPTYIPQTSFWRIDCWYFLFIAMINWGPLNRKTLILIPILSFLNAGIGTLACMAWASYSIFSLISVSKADRIKRIIMIGVVCLISIIINRSLQNELIATIVQLRIGFLKIGDSSFVWFVLPFVWAPMFKRNVKFREELIMLSLFAIFLLPYFWGRSNEYNLLRTLLPVIIIFAIYVSELKLKDAIFALLIFYASYIYSESIASRSIIRMTNLSNLKVSVENHLYFFSSTNSQGQELKKIIDENLAKNQISCFPDSAFDIYLRINEYKGYHEISAKDFLPCTALYFKDHFEKYRKNLNSINYDLVPVRTNEF